MDGKGMKVNNKGFTLVELLITIAIIGLLAAIAIPNLVDALNRSRQRASVAELRLWGIALQDHFAQKSFYPPPAGPAPVDITLRNSLVPFTINTLSIEDKFGFPFVYETDGIGSYTIRSCGKDGICGLGVTPTTWFNYNLDIVLADGIFINSPS
jgi:prepilin-type N-terminal cleavage/methylation domain-containing protein